MITMNSDYHSIHDNNILDISNLSFEGDFDTQIKEVMQYVRMSRDDVEKLQLLFNELQDIFGKTWKGTQLEVFGSVVCGLALRNSDVDCVAILPSWLDEPRATYVIEARKILRRNRNFQNIFAITKAKVPIIQFQYVPTNTDCDVSFSSYIAVRNTKLLECLIFSDERILPLTVLVKYWSKIHSFTGKNLMSSYTLAMLFIFYLQQKNIVPAILSLQQNIDEEIVDNWNTAFVSDFGKCSNNENLYTLLGGFFKYYHKFNFGKYVISLYTGSLIEREKFQSLENVPEEFHLYSMNVGRNICQPLRIETAMCVQDPFNHNRNCAVAVHPKLAHKITEIFNSAALIYEKEPEYSFLRTLLYTESAPQSNSRPVFRNVSAKNHGIKKNYKSKWNPRQIKQNGRYFKQNFNRNQPLRM